MFACMRFSSYTTCLKRPPGVGMSARMSSDPHAPETTECCTLRIGVAVRLPHAGATRARRHSPQARSRKWILLSMPRAARLRRRRAAGVGKYHCLRPPSAALRASVLQSAYRTPELRGHRHSPQARSRKWILLSMPPPGCAVPSPRCWCWQVSLLETTECCTSRLGVAVRLPHAGACGYW